MKSLFQRVVVAVVAAVVVLSAPAQATNTYSSVSPLGSISGGGGSGGGGTINAGTVNDVAYYSGATTIDSNSALSFSGSNVVVNRTGSASVDFIVNGDTQTNLVFVDASGDCVVVGGSTSCSGVLNVQRDQNANTAIGVTNMTNGGNAQAAVYLITDGSVAGNIAFTSSGWTTNQLSLPQQFQMVTASGAPGGILIATQRAFVPIVFAVPIINNAGFANASERLRIGGSESVFNDAGEDVDFRVESDTQANMLFVDASANTLGVRTATPVSGLDSGASFGANITNVTTNTSLDITHFTITCDATAGNVTLSLPAASGVTRRIYNVKKIDSSGNSCIIDPSGAETIDGAATATITTQWTNIQFQCNGTTWYIL